MNEFEKQLKQELEQQTAPAVDRRIWLKINDSWNKKQQSNKTRKIFRWAASAAMIAVLIGSYFFWEMPGQKEQEVLSQYGLMEHNFPKQVAQKIADLNGQEIPVDQAAYFEILKQQLIFLDQQYANYMQYIKENGYQEYIGKQIQNYYEVKIELLEKIQFEMDKLKTKKDENNIEIQNVQWNI